MFLIYCPGSSARCDYVFDWIFRQGFGMEYRITGDPQEFRNYSGAKLNYSDNREGDGLFIRASGLLFQNGISKQRVPVTERNRVKTAFPNPDCDLGFDIFSAVFYMISRYEEYLPFTPDAHGRFRASDSLAFRQDLVQVPIADIWTGILKKALAERFPSLPFRNSEFRWIPTYDIDVAYQYRGRSAARTLGSALKDLAGFRIKELIRRKGTLLQIRKDPWDVYDDLQAIFSENKVRPLFFFLLADNSRYDRNLRYDHPLMKELVSRIGSFSDLGIHPSYYSSLFPEKITREKERLEKLSGRTITQSRQHFLKCSVPLTCRDLIGAGIREDYSMGFPDMAGFRAGTSKPFYFFDLENEQRTGLILYPVTCMEGSFINSGTSPAASWQQILHLIQEVRKVQGIFISIWHNHTLSPEGAFKEWKTVHDQMAAELGFTV
jgi:hypothetical protein